MPHMNAQVLLWGTLLMGCAASEPCLEGGWVADEHSSRLTLLDGTEVQLVVPAGLGRYAAGAPAVVFVRGGWVDTSLPAQELSVRFGSGRGVIQAYLDLPDDARGAQSRAAVASVLSYVAGASQDQEGCFVEDRSGIPLSGERVLVSYSNGANLAWSTLADPTLTLPTVDGLVMFEPPVSPQIGLFDLQHAGYTPGSCALTEAHRLTCGLDYAGIGVRNDRLVLERSEGIVPLTALQDPQSGLWMYSPEAAEAAEVAGIREDWLADTEAASDFWLAREALPQVREALTQFPELAVILTATEEDHAQATIPDQPHITSMMEVMWAAGVRWHRLNPDASYTAVETGTSDAVNEHDANTAFLLGDNPARLPESVGAGRGLITAATLEIMDRTHDDIWQNNLSALLYRR